MADIKQAAKWLQEGKNVRRSSWTEYEWTGMLDGDDEDDPEARVALFYCETGQELVSAMFASDLLAEDWEIAE
jgi:hypothetical protein